jgi:hypothetical protein
MGRFFHLLLAQVLFKNGWPSVCLERCSGSMISMKTFICRISMISFRSTFLVCFLFNFGVGFSFVASSLAKLVGAHGGCL